VADPQPAGGAADPAPIDPATAAAVAREVAALRAEVQEIEGQLDAAGEGADAELMLQDLAGEASDSPPVQLYGFLDTGIRRLFFEDADSIIRSLSADEATFVVGGANVYFDARPSPGWRALLETRLSFYPHGHETVDGSGRFSRVNNDVFDVTSSSGRNKVLWSGIILERAWIEWTRDERLQLRAGYLLTPYGIWNVDHGTPTLISLVLPSFQVEGAIPQHQVGVEVRGSLVGPPWELGYRAYIGNGRTPALLDYTDDKAIGGQVFLRRQGPTTTTVGMSAYYGVSEDSSKMLSFSGGGIAVEETPLYELREWAFGLDFSLDRGPLRLRSEGLIRRSTYPDGLHARHPFAAPGTVRPNRYEYFWYVIAAHRFGRFEPYTFIDFLFRSPGGDTHDMAYTPTLGCNVYFTPHAQLKLQYAATRFYNVRQEVSSDASSKNFRYIDARLVLAF
jgi:hypothetical protein